LPSLAIRDFLPLQPFGLERREGAATFAARRGLGPKAAPACRTKSVDGSTTSVTYKGVEKRGAIENLSNGHKPGLCSASSPHFSKAKICFESFFILMTDTEKAILVAAELIFH
jgi:hypothetical protein